MKKKYLLLVVLIFSVNAGLFSQDKLPDTDILAPISYWNKGSDQPDKGKVVKNGIFFTKSEYGNGEIQSDSSSEPTGEIQKLWKTFEFIVEKSGDYFLLRILCLPII